jgi:HK97 family phage major capsid protein
MTTASLPHTDARNTRDGRHQFSFAKLLSDLASKANRATGLEAEVSAELAERSGRRAPHGAAFAPFDAAIGRRALNTTTGVGSLVAPFSGTVIDVLRNRLVTARLGAKTLEGLHGSFTYPRKTAGATLGWFAEGSAAPASNPTITEQARFSPHSTGASVDYSRFAKDLFLAAVAEMVVDDLVRGVAVQVDAAALAGSGTGNQPTGLLSNPDVGTFAFGTNGAAPSNALLAAMLAQLGNANGNDGISVGYATTPNGEAALRTAFRNGDGSRGLLDGPDFVLGTPWASTNNLPSNLTKGTGTGLSAAVLGSWASLVIGLWEPLIVVNPYLQSTNGVSRITVIQDVDIQLFQPESFVIAADIVTP